MGRDPFRSGMDVSCHPQAGTTPLYDFVELKILLLREDADLMQLKDIDFQEPFGPLARRLKWHLHELCRKTPKLGKRKLGEFRQTTGEGLKYCIYMFIADEGGFRLRAKLRDSALYTTVPVLEEANGRAPTPWNKCAFERACQVIQGPSL